MKKRMLITLGMAVSLFGAAVYAEDAFPVTLTDAMGTEITMEEAPKAIVTMSPAATEIVYAVGAGDALVGRTDYCNFPEEAADVESIGSYYEPNMELILAKTPDLVLASDYIDDEIRAQLEATGCKVCLISANDLAGIEADILNVGKLCGTSEIAEEVVKGMEEDAKELEELLADVEEPVSAFVDLGDFFSAGKGSLLDNALTMAGAVNVCADEESLWPMLTVEALIEKNPDVYISFFPTLETLLGTAGLEELECLQDGEGLIYFDFTDPAADMLQRPGPRFVEGVFVLAEELYPEVFAAEEVDEVEEETEALAS